MSPRLRQNRGPSPRYCGVCGGRIAEMKPDSCVNDTPHIPETEMEAAKPMSILGAIVRTTEGGAT